MSSSPDRASKGKRTAPKNYRHVSAYAEYLEQVQDEELLEYCLADYRFQRRRQEEQRALWFVSGPDDVMFP